MNTRTFRNFIFIFIVMTFLVNIVFNIFFKDKFLRVDQRYIITFLNYTLGMIIFICMRNKERKIYK